MSSMSNLAIPNVAQNGWDANQLDPAVSLLGFPVVQVTDATANPIIANPNDMPNNGTFRFYVDTTPRYRLWAWLNYQNTSGALVGAWQALGGGSSTGTVTSVSVVSANGFAGTVATATTTPAITLSTTITGILQGNGTAISGIALPADATKFLNGTGAFTVPGAASSSPYSVNADEASATAFTTQINFITVANTSNNGWTVVSAGSGPSYTPIGGNSFSISNAGFAGAIANASMQIVAPSASNPTSGFSADTPNTMRLRFYGRVRTATASTTLRAAIGFSNLTGGSDFYSETATDGLDVKFVFDTRSAVGFPTMYAVCSNGAAVTSTNLHIDPTSFHLYEIVLIPYTSAKFYVDGTLATTITTNLYATGSQLMKFEIGSFSSTGSTDISIFIQSPTLSITI